MYVCIYIYIYICTREVYKCKAFRRNSHLVYVYINQSTCR